MLNNDSLRFEVTLPVDDSDRSVVFFTLMIEGLPVPLESTVNGNVLTMSDTIRDIIIPDVELFGITLTITADVIGNGTATVVEDDINGNIDLELIVTEPNIPIPGVPTEFTDNCILVGSRL